MSKSKSKKDIVRVNSDDFEIFQKFRKTKYFNSNIQLFTMAVLIGRYILQESENLGINPQDYVRPADNESSDYLVILKCLVISDMGDVNILNDEDKLYSYCEKYAGPGIRELNKWHNSNEISFEDALATVLMEAWKNIDVDSIKKYKGS